MDLYSLHASIDAVLNYLQKVDPDAAARARLRYSCFDHFSREPQEYGYGPRLERAIGVIYRPESERLSHYFHARLPKQFDAVIHIEETRAVEPLERTSIWDEAELPETYPFKV
jgi:erythromycin esterase-like protein